MRPLITAGPMDRKTSARVRMESAGRDCPLAETAIAAVASAAAKIIFLGCMA